MTKTTPGVCTNFTRSHAAGQEHGGALAGLTLTLTRCFHGGKLLEARSSNRPPGTKSSASAKYSLHASDQLVWSRVLDPAVRVRDPDPQSSVESVLNPTVRVRNPDPQSSVSLVLIPAVRHPDPQAVWSRVLDPAVRVRDPDPQSSVGLVLDPAVRVRDPDPQSSVSLSWNPAVRVRDPDPQKQCEPVVESSCPS